MPQVKQKNLDDILIHFAQKSPDTKVTKEKVNSNSIKFVQGEIDEEKVLRILGEMPKEPRTYLLSKDKTGIYLLDGNHNFCAECELSDEFDINAYIIHLPVNEAIRRLNLMKVTKNSPIKKSLSPSHSDNELIKSAIEAYRTIQKAFNEDLITPEQYIQAKQQLDLVKARSGKYADTAQNRQLKRVGQEYGSKGKQDEPKTDDKAKNSESKDTKSYSDDELKEHAKNASQADLERQIKESDDPKIRKQAHEELDRRSKEEAVQEENPKEPKEKTKKSELEEKDDSKFMDLSSKDSFTQDLYFDIYNVDLAKISSDQNEALSTYRDMDYVSINSSLRDGVDSEKYKKTIGLIDSCFENFELKHNLKLKRGVSKKAIGFFENLNIGDVYQDKSFSSTTINQKSADKFIESDGIEIEILAAKGSKAIPMQNIGDEIYKDEYEFLLPRESKFKVLSKTKNKIKVELL